MVFTDLTYKAMKIAYKAHEGQTDALGAPYIFHPARVGAAFDTEAEVCVGLLHDVVEDTEVTIEDLRKAGFTEDILKALSLMTHEKSVPYMDYVASVAENPLARAVKIEDLKDNIKREPEGENRNERRLEKHIRHSTCRIDGNAGSVEMIPHQSA